QSYSNIEIIIVDNNSSDGTVNKIRSDFKNELEVGEIKLFDLEHNTYPSHGFNYALKKSQGEYVSLFSGDDTLCLNKVERQIGIMVKEGLSNLFTWVNIINDKDEIIKCDYLESIFNRNYNSQQIKEHFIHSGNMLSALSVMLSRDVFDRYGHFDERLVQLQDFDFWLRMASNDDLNLLTEKLSNYRLRDDGGNLSLANHKSRQLRTDFEEVYVYRHLLNFDLKTIQSVVGMLNKDQSIAMALHGYYHNENKMKLAKGFLLSIYEELGTNIVFPSSHYSYFFDIYSKCEFFNSDENDEVSKLKEKIHVYENSRAIRFTSLIVSWLGRLKK
ncbi:glycosyltransferase, partial [Vibrio anguillarum]